ncbi:hypothetical protein PSTT_08440 [Puccinia striiformis]|uniref:Uncharacterized protein n=1 Tax=Puccinia striiformis TaxID=27350 RepID=A0A2S4VCF4_9BASI|nr:hypothetical protein PSTT_08440 [Puccinia striiformis]
MAFHLIENGILQVGAAVSTDLTANPKELLSCTTQTYSDYSARTSGPPGMDTRPSPPTSGFHVTTTHNPGQRLEIQERSNQPPTTWPVCYRLVKTGSSIVDSTLSVLFKATNLLSTGSTAPEKTPHSNPMNPNLNPGQAEELRLQPTQRQGEPYEGIFFEETPVDRTHLAPVLNVNGAAPGVPDPTAPVNVNQTVPVSLVMADPVPEIKGPATVADSGADDGALITLDYCLYVSTFNHLTSAKSKNKNKNDSEKIVPPKNAMPSMRINLHNRTWDELRGGIIRVIGSSRKHLDVYIARLLNGGHLI